MAVRGPESRTTYLPGRGYGGKTNRRRRPRRPTVVTVHNDGHVTASGPGAARAAAQTHRSIRNVHLVERTPGVPSPEEALFGAYYRGVRPDYPSLKSAYGEPFARATEKAYVEHLAKHENLGEPEDITHGIEGATALTGIGGLLRGLGEVGVKEFLTEGASQIAKSTAETAASTGEKKGVSALFNRLSRGAVERAGETRGGQAVGRAVERVPKPVRAAGRTAGRGAALPFRKPLTAPFALQAPIAAVHGDPGELKKALSGTGAYATVLNTIGDHLAGAVPSRVGGNALKDALNLPATVLPSLYLVASDPHKALTSYEQTGLLPALARGDSKAALHTLEEHPVYSGLELSGAASVLGRGTGALARNLSGGRLAGVERPPVHIQGLEHYGNVNEILGRGRYSPDLFRQLLQRGYDRRRGPYATTKQAQRVLRKDIPDRFAYAREQVRRVGRHDATKAMHEARPVGRFRTDKASAGVVAQAVQRVIRSPKTFHDDLRTYKAQLEKEAKSGELTKAELRANKALRKQVEAGIDRGNPEEVVKAANAFIEYHAHLTDELVQRGLLDREQATRAALIPFARVHMGAKYGLSNHDAALAEQLRADLKHAPEGERMTIMRRIAQVEAGAKTVDRHGNDLSTEAIVAEMQRHGVEPPGFLTHRPQTASAGGAFFRSFFPDRQKLPTGKRTGAAVARGTYDASYRALAEQAIRSRSIVDATVGFDELVRHYGVTPPKGVKDLGTAHDALRNPDRYGWHLPAEFQPGGRLELQPIRTAPFNALKRELEASGQHQILDPEDAPVLEGLASKALEEAARPGDGPVAFIPKATFNRLQDHFTPSNPLDKGAQTVNTVFKGAVLPFSPSFYVGNAVDNWMRAALAGIGPTDIALGRKAVTGKTLLGRKVAEPLPAEATESLLPGALYGSFKRINPYRDARQFKGTSLEGVARSLNAVHETPGPKQAISAFTHTRNFLLELNSRVFERLPQYGAVGKELRRDLQARSGYWHHALTVSDGAFRDLVHGLRETPKQIQFAKAVEQVFGNWGKNGPAARSALANLVPFWQWGRASVRFVWMTLPAHHPIKTALLAAASEMTEKERKQFGLDLFAKEPLPGFLQGNVPREGGVTRNLGKYSSFGVYGDLPEFLSGLVFGQGSTTLKNLEGLDWKGDKLTKADGTPAGPLERAKAALLSSVETFLPGFSLMQGVAAGEPGKFSPLATEKGEKLDFLRGLSQSQQITVPASGSSSSSSSKSTVASYQDFLQGSSETTAEKYKSFAEGGG